MLERYDGSSESRANELFTEMLEADGLVDAGIAMFQDKMSYYAKDITSRCGIEGFSENVLIDFMNSAENELNSEWMHEGEVATVSGKVYLGLSEVDIESIPAWGAATRESDGSQSYIIDDIKLRSTGVAILPNYGEYDEGEEAGEIISVKPFYRFSYELASGIEVEILASPDELEQHKYDAPTIEAVMAQLELRWPDELDLMQGIIGPNMVASAIPRRINLIAKKLGDLLQSSPEFRIAAQQFINSELNLDDITPYLIKVQGPVSVNVGSDSDGVVRNHGWRDYNISSDTVIMGFSPIIAFLPGVDGEGVKASLAVGVYSEEEEFWPEKIVIPFESLYEFRSSRTLQSLASRAVQSSLPEGDEQAVERLRASLISLAGVSLDESELQYSEGQSHSELIASVSEQHADATEDNHDDGPERLPGHYERFQYIEEFLSDLSELGGLLKGVVCDTREQAAENVSAWMNEMLTLKPEYHNALSVPGRIAVEASGGVLIPTVNPDIAREVNQEHPGAYIVPVDSGRPIKQLNEIDSFKGDISNISFTTFDVYDDDGETIGYRGAPVCLVSNPAQSHDIVNHGHLPLLRAELTASAMVVMDGSSTVVVEESSFYRRVNAALERANESSDNEEYRDIIETLNELAYEIVSSRRDSQVAELTKTENLAKLSRGLAAKVQDGPVDEVGMVVLKAVEDLFIDSGVSVIGDVYIKDGESLAVHLETQVTGKPFDVRVDAIRGEIALAFGGGESPLIHVPLSKITSLQF